MSLNLRNNICTNKIKLGPTQGSVIQQTDSELQFYVNNTEVFSVGLDGGSMGGAIVSDAYVISDNNDEDPEQHRAVSLTDGGNRDDVIVGGFLIDNDATKVETGEEEEFIRDYRLYFPEVDSGDNVLNHYNPEPTTAWNFRKNSTVGEFNDNIFVKCSYGNSILGQGNVIGGIMTIDHTLGIFHPYDSNNGSISSITSPALDDAEFTALIEAIPVEEFEFFAGGTSGLDVTSTEKLLGLDAYKFDQASETWSDHPITQVDVQGSGLQYVISYEKLIPIMWAAIRNLGARVTALEPS